MSYNTRFKIEFDIPNGSDVTNDQIVSFIKEGSWAYYQSSYWGDCINQYNYSLEMSWYSHMSDMCHLSKAFPTVLFKLYGVGEEAITESDDIWVAYFINGVGKKEKAIVHIGYPVFSDKGLEKHTYYRDKRD